MNPARRGVLAGGVGLLVAGRAAGQPTRNAVSLIALIANPTAFDAQHIQVLGFLRLEFEGDALYLDRESWRAGISRNGIWVDRPPSLSRAEALRLSNHYALLEGTFRAGDGGHMNQFSGALGDITRLEPWDTGDPADR